MAWFFFSRLVGAAVAAITLFVLTWFLGADDFGRYSLVVLSGTIGYYLTASWLPMGVTRFNSSSEFDGRALPMAQGMFLIGMVSAVPAALVCAALVPSAWRETFFLSFSVAYASATHEFGLACLRVQGRGPAFAVAAVLRPLLALALASVVLLAGGGFRSAVAAFAVGAFVAGVLAVIWAVRSSGVMRPSGVALAIFLRFGMPLAAVSGGAMLFPLTSQLLLAWMVNLREAGFFAAASALAERTLVMLMVALRQATAADIFHAHEQGRVSSLDAILHGHYSLLLFIGAPVAGVYAFAPETITRILFNGDFGAGVALYLPALAVAAFVNGISGSFLGFVFELLRQTRRELVATSGLLVLHAALSAAWIAAVGGVGAAYAAVVSAFFMLIAYGWCARRVLIRRTQLIPLAKVAAALAAGGLVLVAADRFASMTAAVACVALGLLVMLVVLKALRYSSLERIQAAVIAGGRGAPFG